MKHPMKVVRPLRSGQITIPAEFREKLAITQDTLLQIILVGRELRIRPVKVSATSTGPLRAVRTGEKRSRQAFRDASQRRY